MKNATKTPLKTNMTVATYEALNSMEAKELRAIAKAGKVSCGKSKKNTVANIVAAITAGKLNIKSLVTISIPPVAPAQFGTPIAVRKFRSYKPDKWAMAPVTAQ